MRALLHCLSFNLCLAAFASPLAAQSPELPQPTAVQQSFEMQGSTLFEGNARNGCCYEIGTVRVWDLTP